MQELNPEEKKICRVCNIPKRLKSFQTLKSGNKGGVCNLCKAQGKRIQREPKPSRIPKNIELQMGYVRKEDWVETYKFLQRKGYVLSGDKTIHQQFCEKYGLTPNIPEKTFKNHYSPSDLGLI